MEAKKIIKTGRSHFSDLVCYGLQVSFKQTISVLAAAVPCHHCHREGSSTICPLQFIGSVRQSLEVTCTGTDCAAAVAVVAGDSVTKVIYCKRQIVMLPLLQSQFWKIKIFAKPWLQSQQKKGVFFSQNLNNTRKFNFRGF